MIDCTLSDLFFNHEHPEYDALMGGSKEDAPTNEQIYAAVEKDANGFLLAYSPIFSCEVPRGNDLTNDFMNRL